ncbi:hypothetical protein IJG01_02570, partial [Candidatus Saccharibacteria bacterium]|nr:hypothetical protein [Candidatus Saccharibacteria bacterium]
IYTAEAGKTLKESNTNGTTSFQFKIAAKASNTQPSGEYNNVINFTVTSNPRPMEISDLTYMQDFATLSETDMATVLASMNLEQQYQLRDSRDNKTYYISKLVDGNIWMTQNLDHDIDSTKTYTPADTDIPANWTPSTSTYATSNTTWNGSDTAPESYNPGDYYWNGTDGMSAWSDYWNSGGTNPASNFMSTTGNSHYHLGNYYNWTAAMAMNDSSSYTTSTTRTDQSICPAGWTLPRAGSGEDTFYGLWSQYGYDNSGTFSNISTLTGSPAYFAPTGGWYGSFGDVGAGGYFWSPVVVSSVDSYYAYFYMFGEAGPSGYDGRDVGYSIRCVARPVASTIEWGSGGGNNY